MDPKPPVNPYIAGSPITGTEMFYGRADVFSFIKRNLTGLHRDTPIVLYGQRRTGKTSVLYQLHRHLDPRYRCIFIDLHGLSLDGMGNLLYGIASSVSRSLQRDHQLKIEVPDRMLFMADPRSAFETRFLDDMWQALGDDHLVLMMDETVRLHEEVQAGRLDREIFEFLRHLMQHFTRLNFIFSLGSGLEEMAKDYAFLFSVSLYHRISFLEPAAARELITRPVRGHYEVTPPAVTKILEITSGHPYYVQLVCHCMFDSWSRAPKPVIDAADVEAVRAEAIELGSANLTYVWEDSAPEEKALMAGVAVMQHGTAPVSIDDALEAWRALGVRLPEREIARALRSLTSREVLAGDQAYRFNVDLQRLWCEKHRHMDWVKDELADAIHQWHGTKEPWPPDTQGADSPPSLGQDPANDTVQQWGDSEADLAGKETIDPSVKAQVANSASANLLAPEHADELKKPVTRGHTGVRIAGLPRRKFLTAAIAVAGVGIAGTGVYEIVSNTGAPNRRSPNQAQQNRPTLSPRSTSTPTKSTSTPTKPPVVKPELRWKQNIGGSLAADASNGGGKDFDPAVVNGVVYAGGASQLYAIGAANGRQRWQYQTGAAIAGAPAVSAGLVYVCGGDTLYALAAPDGGMRWHYQFGGTITAGPVVVAGVVYARVDSILFALDASNGNVQWNSAVGSGYSKPAVSAGMVYIAGGSLIADLLAVDASTGILRWRYHTGGVIYCVPAVAGGLVYFGSEDKNVYAVSALTGHLRWTYTTGGYVYSNPALAGSVIYVGSLDEYLYAIDAATGTLQWRYHANGSITAGPTPAEGSVYVLTYEGEIYALAEP